MEAVNKLRKQLESKELIVAPGAWDGISARLIEQAGFPVAYMTGAGVAAANGYPDFGLVTLTEMTAAARTLTRSVSIPVIADADTGFGNALNVRRTVQEYEKSGVAAIQIEDQLFPKRCGHLEGKELVQTTEFVEKIAAAAAARGEGGMLIVARTDARAVTGLDDAIERVNRALDAGADIAFVEAPQSAEEAAAIARRVNGPCLLNLVPGGKTPNIPLKDVAELGFRIAILPGLLLTSMMGAADLALATVRNTGRVEVRPDALPIRDLFNRLGALEWQYPAASATGRDGAR
ncbi:isocitrate lyase/PEP mutase family protein [Paraburkholderia strydomiana]|uniref:isocitrate lyase/PEP mutase family protein n=1 Tax=Paraburkholderia TaxID=1822464 RepID=UPI000B48DC01|nr:carboxyvinyl-carboxyphosphonate phosphorylmutase [Burkholderia sp. Bk]